MQRMLVGFSFSKIIAEHKDSKASEGPHDLFMRPFYYESKVKTLTCRNNYSTRHAKLVIYIYIYIYIYVM